MLQEVCLPDIEDDEPSGPNDSVWGALFSKTPFLGSSEPSRDLLPNSSDASRIPSFGMSDSDPTYIR